MEEMAGCCDKYALFPCGSDYLFCGAFQHVSFPEKIHLFFSRKDSKCSHAFLYKKFPTISEVDSNVIFNMIIIAEKKSSLCLAFKTVEQVWGIYD